MLCPPTTFTLPFIRKVQLTDDCYSFFFDRTKAPSSWDFAPGQYNRVIIPHANPDDRGTSRFFTIASSPHITNELMITTKIGKSTYKQAMLQLSPGEMPQFWGPTGKFVFPEDTSQPLVFIAGGIGITPFHSMITYAHARRMEVPITLFVSFTHAEEKIYYDELSAIANVNDLIRIVYTISKPQESTIAWTGEAGRITKELLAKYGTDFTKERYFICGPQPMVEATQELLRSMAIHEEKMIIEKFSGY